MNIVLDVIVGVVIVVVLLLAFFEYRIRQPDFLVLHESNGRISLRKGMIYPRHFSLPLQRTTCPIQLTVEATAAGNVPCIRDTSAVNSSSTPRTSPAPPC